MTLATKTNGQFDTAAAAVPAPFGPFTRVDNVAAVAPNSHLPVQCTAFGGTKTIYVSFDTLNDAKLLEAFIRDTFGIEYLLYQISLVSKVLAANIAEIDPPLTTAAEKQEILKSLSIIPTLFGTFPWKAHIENDKSLEVQVDFSGTPSGADLALVQDIDGQYYLKLWDFGDGATSLDDNPTHTYDLDGTYDVRLIVIGAGGIKEKRKSFTINVP
jgi:hypothetical protein